MHKIDVFEKAALLCGYQLIYVKYGNRKHVLFAEGYIPNVEGRFFWHSCGLCYRKKNRKRMEIYDLPIQTAIELLNLEEFSNVCGL